MNIDIKEVKKIRNSKLAWNRKGQIKLSDDNFYEPEKGVILPNEILDLISDRSLMGLVKDGSIKDISKIIKEQDKAEKEAIGVAKKAREARGKKLSLDSEGA